MSLDELLTRATQMSSTPVLMRTPLPEEPSTSFDQDELLGRITRLHTGPNAFVACAAPAART